MRRSVLVRRFFACLRVCHLVASFMVDCSTLARRVYIYNIA
nr:MAG TPA: hypothetical protein [Caudoviricetes sp.]